MFERIAVSLTQVKQKLKGKKYRDDKSGRDIAFSTAYSRGNEKAMQDFNQLRQELKKEESKEKPKKKVLKKNVVPDNISQKALESFSAMDWWVSNKKKKQEENIKKINKQIEDINQDTKLSKAQKTRKIKEKKEEIKKESANNYAFIDQDSVESLSKIIKNNDLSKLLPAENFDDFMTSFINRNSELSDSIKNLNPKEAFNTMKKLKGEKIVTKAKKKKNEFSFYDDDDEESLVEEEGLEFEPVSNIIDKIKKIKDPSSKESKAELGELSNKLAESLSIEHIYENVILNPTVGLPKFKSIKMMTPKAMTKIYSQELDRYSSLPLKERNDIVKKLDKKIEKASGAEKEVLEKAMDAAVTDIILESLKNPETPKFNKLPKNRVLSDPRIPFLANKFGRKDFLEKSAELTRTTDAKVHRDVMSNMLKSLTDEQFEGLIVGDDRESPLFRPFLEKLDPTYCPIHPHNERGGNNVDDDECPVRLTEKQRDQIKQTVIDLYEDTTFFIAGGINLEGYDEDETTPSTYSKRYDDVKTHVSKSSEGLSVGTKDKIKNIMEGIESTRPDDVIQEQETYKLVNEMRQNVTQHHIDTLGNIAVGLAKVISKNKNASKEKKIEWIQNAFETIPGFPKLK